MKKPIAKGDFCLMPFAGSQYENLVVVGKRVLGSDPAHWRIVYLKSGYATTAQMDAARRITPSQASRIIPSKRGK